ncbi:anaerobic carbon-monoxide dehydrogenase catalytic subunit [Candidatus Latescibacterota bacterium]
MAENNFQKSIDPASLKLIKQAEIEGIETVWDRKQNQQPHCGFGTSGVCCRICTMGPCRITKKAPKGVCGATVDVIVARNFARMVAGGAASHSDHGRDIVFNLLRLVDDNLAGMEIGDSEKLMKVAVELNIETKDKDINEVAREVALKCLGDFGKQTGELNLMQRAPEKTKEMWRENGLMPRGIDREIVEIMHRTHIGVDNDYKNILDHSIRASLADGWGGSMIATDLSDIIFGSPKPVRGQSNIGVLQKDQVNIIVHGHDPTLSELIVRAAKDPEIIKETEEAGASGINIGGMCCTANEILMRHGIPVVGNHLQQELAIITGATDLMVVDVQCIFPAIVDIAEKYHTEIITTSSKAKFTGATFIDFEEGDPLEVTKEIIKTAIEKFKERGKKDVHIPEDKKELIAGFTAENTFNFLGGRYRSTYRPLNNAIMEGRLRGAVAVVGCNNPAITQDLNHVIIARELLRHDILVVETGCSAVACAKQGLLTPEAAMEYAGDGLREVCEAVGIPPILHAGSCVDNSRILITLTNMVKEGGLGDSLADLPVAGCAPEWMSEKAVSIGLYCVGSGLYVDMSPNFPISGSENVLKYLTEDIEKITGGKFAFKTDPIAIAHGMIDHIEKKREKLKLRPMMYPVKDIPVEVSAPE